MIGHDVAEQAFVEAWSGGRLHHAWLLAGPQGMGKAAFAARAARFLVTHGRGGEGQTVPLDDSGDAAAERLVAAGNHPEILTLERLVKDKGQDLARHITNDPARGMIRRSHLSPSLCPWPVTPLDAAHDSEPPG